MAFPVPDAAAGNCTNYSNWPVAAYPIASLDVDNTINNCTPMYYRYKYELSSFDAFYQVEYDLDKAGQNPGYIVADNAAELRERLNMQHGCLPGFTKTRYVREVCPELNVDRTVVLRSQGGIMGIYRYPAYAIRACMFCAADVDKLIEMVQLTDKVFVRGISRINCEPRNAAETLSFRDNAKTAVVRGMYILDEAGVGNAWFTYNPRRAAILSKRKKTMRLKYADAGQSVTPLSTMLDTILRSYFTTLWTNDYYLFGGHHYWAVGLTRTISTAIVNINTACRIAEDRGMESKMILETRKEILGLCLHAGKLNARHNEFFITWVIPKLKKLKAPKKYWAMLKPYLSAG